MDGSLGDTLFCLSQIEKSKKNSIVFTSTKISKNILDIFIKNKFIFYLAIGGFLFRKIVYLTIKNAPLISKFINLGFCIFNNKGMIYKTYEYKKNKVFLVKKCKIIDSEIKQNELFISDNILKNINNYGDYIIVNMDVDKSVRRKIIKYSLRPTKLPTVNFYEKLVLDLKLKIPNYKFIQVGEAGTLIKNVDINLVGKTNLIQLTQLIQNAKLTITIEGGIRALCTFLNAPAVAIFGPTSQLLIPTSKSVSDVRYSSCKPCWRDKKEWYSKCHKNNDGEALCTSDATLLPQINNLSLLIKNALR
jgi:hypothetical protein